jgi:catechol 2,3-dioxygenase-like lactoylglutathione lyase family enzyme
MATPSSGLTHIALPVTDLGRSVAFYEAWAGMTLIDRLTDPATGNQAGRLSDGTGAVRPCPHRDRRTGRGAPGGRRHLGVACTSREAVDRLAGRAREKGCLVHGPSDSGYPLGYWAFLVDPDGHQLELSYGQNDPPPVPSAD